jgi:hypothetical protein
LGLRGRKNEDGENCVMRVFIVFYGKNLREGDHLKTRRRWEDNIKMDL